MENTKSNADVTNFSNDGKANVKNIVCPLCNKGIKEKNLEEHARRIHGKALRFIKLGRRITRKTQS